MKKIFTTLLLICFFSGGIKAAEYDTSVDSDIRKQYNVNELPELPKVTPTKVEMPKEIKNYNYTGKTYTLKSGTKIYLVSKEKVSNWSAEGIKVSFLLQNPVTTKEGAIIPAGTLFKGTVTDSHAPQITGNGGLIELKINEIYYNGAMSIINTKLSEVNSKKIYRSDIKGKRKYLQNCAKAVTPGKKVFKTMEKAGKKLMPIPVVNILSIVPYTIGGAFFIVNASFAPVASVFMKGGAVSLPAGTVFEITVSGNNQIRG